MKFWSSLKKKIWSNLKWGKNKVEVTQSVIYGQLLLCQAISKALRELNGSFIGVPIQNKLPFNWPNEFHNIGHAELVSWSWRRGSTLDQLQCRTLAENLIPSYEPPWQFYLMGVWYRWSDFFVQNLQFILIEFQESVFVSGKSSKYDAFDIFAYFKVAFKLCHFDKTKSSKFHKTPAKYSWHFEAHTPRLRDSCNQFHIILFQRRKESRFFEKLLGTSTKIIFCLQVSTKKKVDWLCCLCPESNPGEKTLPKRRNFASDFFFFFFAFFSPKATNCYSKKKQNCFLHSSLIQGPWQLGGKFHVSIGKN